MHVISGLIKGMIVGGRDHIHVGGDYWSRSVHLNSYSETCLDQTSLGPTFVFGIDRWSVYTG